MIEPSSSVPTETEEIHSEKTGGWMPTIDHIHGVESIGSFFEMHEGVVFQFLHSFNGIGFELFEGFSDLFFGGVHHQISHVENSNLNENPLPSKKDEEEGVLHWP